MFSLACHRTRRLLWDYAQGGLSEADQSLVRAHLDRCERCRQEAGLYAQTVAGVAALRVEAEPVPAGGWAAVRERLAVEPARPRPLPYAGIAIAGAGLACGAALLLTHGSSPDRTVRSTAGPANADPRPVKTGHRANSGPSRRTAGVPAGGSPQRMTIAPRMPGTGARPVIRGFPPQERVPLDDLAYLNTTNDPTRWAPMRDEEVARVKARVDRTLRTGDDFVDVPFPRLASANGDGLGSATDAYEREKRVVDPRLERTVSLAVKAMSFSDLSRELSERSSVRITASRTVADEKVTVFCKDQPIRELMREINHLFGFTWSRTRRVMGEKEEYQYELTQTLRAQLAEEELRNRDLNAAMVALDDEVRKPLPPEGADADRDLRQLSSSQRTARDRIQQQRQWTGASALYGRLSPEELGALRNGQTVEFSTESERPERRVPDELRRSLLQTLGGPRFTADGHPADDDNGLPLEDLPGAGISLSFSVEQRAPGQLSLRVEPHYNIIRDGQRIPVGGRGSYELGAAQAPSVARPENAAANRDLEQQPQFHRRVSWKPKWSCPVLTKNGIPEPSPPGPFATVDEKLASEEQPPMPHLTSADVWEGVFEQTGMPIVADSYSRLYPAAPFAAKNEPLFAALCRTGDDLGARWKKDGEFLLCRSTSFAWDNLQEIPNRLLERWRRHRAERGETTAADLLEMATLSDAQLNSRATGQFVRHCCDLPEWRLLARTRNSAYGLGSGFPWLLRALTTLPLGVRDRAFQPAGMALADLPSASQAEVVRALQQWNYQPLLLTGARLRLEFVPAGRYLWYPPIQRFSPDQYFALPLAGGRSPEEALRAAQRIDPAAQAGEIHRSPGALTLFLNYGGRLSTQGRPE